jgi:transposase
MLITGLASCKEFGHTVRLMATQFIKPYVKTNKNDAADAEEICEAVEKAVLAVKLESEISS